MSEQLNLWDFLSPGFRNPPTEYIAADRIPDPYRKLLVHNGSMTLRLEGAYGEELQLRVLKQESSRGGVVRQVLLYRPSDGKAVEMGWIRVHLETLPAEVGRQVEEGERPLGKLLRELGVEYSNRPSSYFQVVCNGTVGEALGLSGPAELYGRRNRLLTPQGQILAEVVEVLAPFDPAEP